MSINQYVGGNFLDSGDAPEVDLAPGLRRQALLSGKNLALCLTSFEEGGLLPQHTYPHEQAGYVIFGSLELDVGGIRYAAEAGSAYLIRGDLGFSARAIEPSLTINGF